MYKQIISRLFDRLRDYLIDYIDQVQPLKQLSKLNEQRYKKMEDLDQINHQVFSEFYFLKKNQI
jgi:hypothetical protein